MDLDQFHIGVEFWMSGHLYRCTDIGTRTIVAIRISGDHPVVLMQGGVQSVRTLTRAEAEEQGWFSGPTYAVVEHVMDEDDLEACSLEPDERTDAGVVTPPT